MIKLYQFPISHYCEKVRWTLDHKGNEYKTINLLPGLHIKQTKKIAKYSSVPLLVDGETILQNSEDIINYLEATYPLNSLTPKEDEDKKKAMQWEQYVDKELGIHVRCVCYHVLLDHPDIVIPFFTHKGPWYGKLFLKFGFNKLQSKMRYFMQINEQTAQESYEKMKLAINKLDQHLQNRDFIVGNEFSRADIAAASLLAPLCQPQGYGLDWPENTPQRLLNISNEFKDQLEWVHRVYSKNR